jgi:uncharacterized protein (TIGR02284 family)
MTIVTQTIRETLTRLAEICHDGDLGFASASAATPDGEPLLKSELLQYSLQRREFAADLEFELARLGDEAPPSHGTVAAAVHRGWMNLKKAIAANQRYAILTECQRSEEVAVEAYRDALNVDMPGVVSDLITVQYHAVSRVLERIRSLCEASRSN